MLVVVELKGDVGCIQFLLDGIVDVCEKEVTKTAAIYDQTAIIIKSTAIL